MPCEEVTYHLDYHHWCYSLLGRCQSILNRFPVIVETNKGDTLALRKIRRFVGKEWRRTDKKGGCLDKSQMIGF